MYQRTVQWAAACCRNFQNVLHRMQVRQDETLAKEGCMYVHEAASAPQMLLDITYYDSENRRSYDAPRLAIFRKQEIVRCSSSGKLQKVLKTNCAIYLNILYKYN